MPAMQLTRYHVPDYGFLEVTLAHGHADTESLAGQASREDINALR